MQWDTSDFYLVLRKTSMKAESYRKYPEYAMCLFVILLVDILGKLSETNMKNIKAQCSILTFFLKMLLHLYPFATMSSDTTEIIHCLYLTSFHLLL
jgi:hypothetical protein